MLLAAAAIQLGDPRAAGIAGGVLETARHQGYLHTIVTTAPEVTRYLVEHSAQVQPEPFLERIIAEGSPRPRSGCPVQANASPW
jgi:LuxR family transcriptional regulator, maltose regulon positive regulatory protein